MKKISLKDYYLSILSESDDKVFIDESIVSDISDISYDKKEDYIRLDFTTTYGKKMSLLTKYSQFKNWFKKCDCKDNVYTDFIKDFIKNSEEQVNEIIDDTGQIIGDNPMPNNSTNSLVGTSVFDTEKIYKTLPRISRMYMGDLGIGIIAW